MKTAVLLTSSFLLLPSLFAAPIVKSGDKIAFMGDSITEFGNYKNGYLDLTIDGLARAGVKATKIPAGWSGNVAEQMAGRFDRDVVAKKPNWCTIMAGVNDASRYTVEQYIGFIRTMVEKSLAAGITPVLVTPTLTGEMHWYLPNANKKTDDYSAALKALAAEKKLPLADVHEAFKADLKARGKLGYYCLTCDNLHMSALGDALIAGEILRAFGVDDATIAAAKEAWRNYPRTERLSVQATKPTAAESFAWMRGRIAEILALYPKAHIALTPAGGSDPKTDALNNAMRAWADGKTVFWSEHANGTIQRSDRGFAEALAAAEGKKPVFLNFDDTHFLYTRGRFKEDIGEREIRAMISPYRGTDLTDFVLCAGGRIADIPNKFKTSWVDKYDQKRENGCDVDYSNNDIARLAKEIWRDKKLDPYALWIDEAKKCGFRPWLSFRLNDCHGSPDKTSLLHPDFYHEHPECRRVRNRPYAGWFDIGYDWSFKEVREREFGYIVEVMERYDVTGIELDWTREMYCFVPGRENAEVITDFMRRIRAEADRIGATRGKRIKMLARVNEDPEVCWNLGFDPATWAHEGLVDILVAAPRWRNCDTDIPVALWKRLLSGTDTMLLTGSEILLCERRDKRYYVTTEQLVGLAAVNYARGADGAYVFNLFDDPFWQVPERRYWKIGDQPNDTLAVFWPNQRKILSMLGSPEKLYAAERDHVITFRDLKPEWERTTLEPEWNTRDEPFPATLVPGSTRYFRIPTGPVADNRSLVLRIGIETPDPKLQVFVNGRATKFLRTETCVPKHTAAPLYVFEINAKEYVEDAAVVELLVTKPVDLSYMDIRVR